MAIDRDIKTRTAVAIDYTRTGNTLNRRERHGVKDSTGTIIITFDELTHYVGQAGLDYLDELTNTRDGHQGILTSTTARNDATELEMQENVDFLTAQVDEINALL